MNKMCLSADAISSLRKQSFVGVYYCLIIMGFTKNVCVTFDLRLTICFFWLHSNQNPDSSRLMDTMMSFPGIDNACLDKSDNPYVITPQTPAAFLKKINLSVILWVHMLSSSIYSTLLRTYSVFIFHSLSFFSCLLFHLVSFY